MRLMLVLLFAASAAFGAPCPVSTGTCPAYTSCVSWDAATVKDDGKPYATGELKGYELSLNGNPFPLIAGTAYSFPIPANQSLRTTDVWSIATVAFLNGIEVRSVPFTCENALVIPGPTPKPLAPKGFKQTRG